MRIIKPYVLSQYRLRVQHFIQVLLKTLSFKRIALSGTSVFLLLVSIENWAIAQIEPDETLGIRSSRIDNSIPGVITIRGGERSGSNLFHSFREFNVRDGQEVYFTYSGSGTRGTIISRVTGSNVSRIMGLLGVQGSANLFLINQNGIIFGPNSRLDIRGSFLATTADSLVFEDGSFSATDPEISPVLTVSAPLGLQFGEDSGDIVVRSRVLNDRREISGLEIDSGQTLALAARNISLNNGHLSIREGESDSSRIEVAGISGTAFVRLDPIVQEPFDPLQQDFSSFRLGYSEVESFGRIRLFNQSSIRTSEIAPGEIHIQGGRVSLFGGSQIEASTGGLNRGGLITLDVADLLISGSVELDTDRSVETGLFANSNSIRPDSGNAGNIEVEASRRIELIGAAGIASVTQGGGNSGIIRIRAGRLVLGDGAQILSLTSGDGRASRMRILADDVRIEGTREISEDSFDSIAGLDDNRRSSIPSLISVQSQGDGNSGQLRLRARNLVLLDGGQISTTAFASGNAGNVIIDVADSIVIGGEISPDQFFSSGIFAQVDGGAKGNGGDLIIETQRLSLENGGRVSTGTIEESRGDGGGLTVFATDSLEISGSNSFRIPGRTTREREIRTSALSSESRGSGQAGALAIFTGDLIVEDRAQIALSTQGANANAGNLRVTADSVRLSTFGQVSTETKSGNGGAISMQVQDLLSLSESSTISTSAGRAGEGGDGGSISINADFVAAVPTSNNDITANAFLGRGGGIEITAEQIFGLSELRFEELQALLGTTDPSSLEPERLSSSDVTAISQTDPRLNGDIVFNTSGIDPSRGLVELPTDIVDASSLLARGCVNTQQLASRARGEFLITGRGGLTPPPEDTRSGAVSLYPWISLPSDADVNGVTTYTDGAELQQPIELDASLVEAQGWVLEENGEISLVATASRTQQISSTPIQANQCQD